MLEILDIEQGTPEWYEARRGLPTASCAGKILAKGAPPGSATCSS